MLTDLVQHRCSVTLRLVELVGGRHPAALSASAGQDPIPQISVQVSMKIKIATGASGDHHRACEAQNSGRRWRRWEAAPLRRHDVGAYPRPGFRAESLDCCFNRCCRLARDRAWRSQKCGLTHPGGSPVGEHFDAVGALRDLWFMTQSSERRQNCGKVILLRMAKLVVSENQGSQYAQRDLDGEPF